jgi:hypothetical protein
MFSDDPFVDDGQVVMMMMVMMIVMVMMAADCTSSIR